jgi:hypothetical protein
MMASGVGDCYIWEESAATIYTLKMEAACSFESLVTTGVVSLKTLIFMVS